MISLRHIGLVAALSAITASAVGAQPPEGSSRPYRGLFGGAQPLSSRSQSLDLTLSGFGGWDEPNDVGPQVNPQDTSDRVDIEGPYSGASTTLVYTRPGENLILRGVASGFYGYFPDNESPSYTSSSAALDARSGFDLGRRTRLTLSELVGWSTDYRLGYGSGTPGSDIPLASGSTNFDNSLERAPSLDTQSRIEFSHRLSRKASLTALYNYRYVYYFDTSDDEPLPNGQDHHVGIRYDYRLTQYATFRAGYGYRRSPSRTDDTNEGVFHDVDLGVNYNRTLSFSRRTRLSFNTGSTIVINQAQGEDGSTFGDPQPYIIGGAQLTHELGRTWQAFADYNRSVSFLDGFTSPSLNDRASAGVGGLMGRRTDLSSGVSWSTGSIGLDENNYHAWHASAQVRFALTRGLALFGSYYYYMHEFGASVQLPRGVVSSLDRQGVRVGLTTWVPLWASRGTQ